MCFLDCQLVFFSNARSVVYFTFCTIAIFTALDSVACTFVACFSINTQNTTNFHGVVDLLSASRRYASVSCMTSSVLDKRQDKCFS